MQAAALKDSIPDCPTATDSWTLCDGKTLEVVQVGDARRYALADRHDRVMLGFAELVADRRAAAHELRRQASHDCSAALLRGLARRARAVRVYLRGAPAAPLALRASSRS